MAFHMSRAARVRALPFLMFMVLLALRGWLPPEGLWGIDPRWVYGLSVLVVGGMLIAWRRNTANWRARRCPTRAKPPGRWPSGWWCSGCGSTSTRPG